MNIILASASIRRQELLKRLVNDFQIIISEFEEEKIKFNGNCGRYVISLAKGKCLDVASRVKESSLIIGCDTIVVYKDQVLGKPKNEEEAFKMLKLLSDSKHEVYTGIALYDTKTNKLKTDYVITEVEFSNISDEDIINYIKTKEPMDKAGAYGIQGLGGVFVKSINGCFYNVVGLPINRLKYMLMDMGE